MERRRVLHVLPADVDVDAGEGGRTSVLLSEANDIGLAAGTDECDAALTGDANDSRSLASASTDELEVQVDGGVASDSSRSSPSSRSIRRLADTMMACFMTWYRLDVESTACVLACDCLKVAFLSSISRDLQPWTMRRQQKRGRQTSQTNRGE